MNYPFSINETELLLNYLRDNYEDALVLSEACFTNLVSGSMPIIIEMQGRIPALPNYIVRKDTTTEILNTSIRDFFVVFKIVNETKDIEKSIEEFWQLKYRSNNVSKLNYEDDHLILLCNRYFKIDFFEFFETKNRLFFEVLGAFANTIHVLEFEVDEMINALELIRVAAKGDSGSHSVLYGNLSELPKYRPNVAEELFDLILEER